jgi:3-oxoacyl-[acyl-carrier-protein] synthase-3
MVDTTDEWIQQRVGIRERHIVDNGMATSHLATAAAQQVLDKTQTKAEEVDLIIVATVTPDMFFPATACLVQTRIGATHAWGFDLSGACSGFVYALTIGAQFVGAGTHKKALVIGSDVMSSIIDYQDRNTCVLFGDGAGAAILQNRADSHGLLTAVMGADGTKADLLSMPGGGSACPATLESVSKGMHYLRMDGKETFKNAVNAMVSAANEAMRRCEIDITKIKCVIPHQANQRIVSAVGERLGTTPEQLFVNLHKYGNTSAASVAIALDEAVTSGKISRGDLILLVVFGAGLTWGAAVIEW